MGAGFLVQFESLYKSTEKGDENADLGAGMVVLPFAHSPSVTAPLSMFSITCVSAKTQIDTYYNNTNSKISIFRSHIQKLNFESLIFF